MSLRPQLFIMVLGWTAIGIAQSSSANCDTFSNYKDVIRCAIENHPDAQQAKLLFKQNENLVGIAEQRPNIELDSQVLGGRVGDDSYQYTQINLAHTFELGGKRDARIRRSEAQVRNSGFDLKLVQEQIYLKTYLAMVRIRQINAEIAVYDDALTTFERIQKQYQSRPRMTPEQKATYAIMDIAASDYRLRRRPLVNEVRENEKFLEMATGKKFDVRKDFLPTFRKKWPTVSSSGNSDTTRSLTLQKSITDLEVAQAELKEAESLAWPDLKLGPTFETQSAGSQKTNSFGLNLSFAIPLFHTNGAGKAYATAGISRAQVAVANAKNIESQRLQLQIDKYKDAVNSLENSLSSTELDRKHRDVESSFGSGVIPSSLVIEIHRQMADYVKSLSEQENTAIEALANIYSIEGRLLSEGL
ncbi:MAG: TolC family protein [Bdellovibrionaceae bacterium]|nr:TolC family protein [Pseudobdellovibrionaceae bacterium]